jgi:hypothetical protein
MLSVPAFIAGWVVKTSSRGLERLDPILQMAKVAASPSR